MKHSDLRAHKDAEMVIDHLVALDGESTVTSRDIAKSLGLSNWRFAAARRHTHDCPSLGGFVVAYRRKNKPIVLLDPSTKESLKAIIDRSHPLMQGYEAQRAYADTVRLRLVATFTTASTEAAGRGEKDLSKGFGYAADDLRVHGSIQPATIAFIEKVLQP